MSGTSRKAVALCQDMLKSPWVTHYHKSEIDDILDEVNRNYDAWKLCANEMAQVEKGTGDDEDEAEAEQATVNGFRVWGEDLFRTKRCLMAYLRHRVMRIRDTR